MSPALEAQPSGEPPLALAIIFARRCMRNNLTTTYLTIFLWQIVRLSLVASGTAISRYKILTIAGLLSCLLMTNGCTTVLQPSSFTGTQPELKPESFFAGRTHSWGILESSSGAPSKHLEVGGLGQAEDDGTIRLQQTVDLDKQVTNRIWVMRRIDEHHYEGTLTDAAGLVHGEAYGNVFHLKYDIRGKPGVTMEQWMYLLPDGRTLLNEDVIRAFGIVVARVSELITHDDRPISAALAQH